MLGHVEAVKPTLLVIDSVQTISAGDVDGVPGGVTQVKEVSAALIRMAKLRNITLVIIGHVTKDGSIAGPRVLEHLVDVVLHFEGERTSRLRMVRAVKNRYGPVDEVGCFDLSAEGIVAITDPTGLFLDTRHGPVPGTCVAVALEGRRPLLSEVQALVTHSAGERPRRTTSGVDSARVAMIIAVLQQHAGIRLHSFDVFVSSVGGARLTEPSNDVAIALAIASAWLRPAAGAATSWPSASSGSPASCAGPATSACGSPRPAGWASARPLVPAVAPESAGNSRVLDGMRVVDVDNIARALTLLGLEKDDDAAGRALPIDSARGFPRRVDDATRLRATLAVIAPGTSLRDGLERILRGRTGALIVLGHDAARRRHPHRRLHPRRPVHRHRAARAGQDGRRASCSTATSPGSTAPTCT